jgi:anthranilate phosphoribosyltransferase
MMSFFEFLSSGQPLDEAQIQEAAAFLVDAAAPATEKADFLRALAQRGETPEEIAGFVRAFLLRAVDPQIDPTRLPGPMLDVVGTGGDKLHLFNVSTTAMFILAAGGVCVTKHGNRGITSKAGGADVLEALGVKIDLPVERVRQGIEEIGLGFFFAPLYHPAFKAVAEARKILAAEGQRSIFNILGPLLNPARPAYQLIGVFEAGLTDIFGRILQSLGRKGAWIVHGSAGGDRGMDELSTLGLNTVCQLSDGVLSHAQVDPQALGFHAADVQDLVGGDAQENAALLEQILSGKHPGPKSEIAVLNAAAGFVITGVATDLPSGKELAEHLLQSGEAMVKLQAMRDIR